MKKYKIGYLGPVQIWRLRQDISLCSLYLSDYENRYNIDCDIVFSYFDGYADYLGELMENDGIKDSDYFLYVDKYDTKDNLLYYHENNGNEYYL